MEEKASAALESLASVFSRALEARASPPDTAAPRLLPPGRGLAESLSRAAGEARRVAERLAGLAGEVKAVAATGETGDPCVPWHAKALADAYEYYLGEARRLAGEEALAGVAGPLRALAGADLLPHAKEGSQRLPGVPSLAKILADIDGAMGELRQLAEQLSSAREAVAGAATPGSPETYGSCTTPEGFMSVYRGLARALPGTQAASLLSAVFPAAGVAGASLEEALAALEERVREKGVTVDMALNCTATAEALKYNPVVAGASILACRAGAPAAQKALFRSMLAALRGLAGLLDRLSRAYYSLAGLLGKAASLASREAGPGVIDEALDEARRAAREALGEAGALAGLLGGRLASRLPGVSPPTRISMSVVSHRPPATTEDTGVAVLAVHSRCPEPSAWVSYGGRLAESRAVRRIPGLDGQVVVLEYRVPSPCTCRLVAEASCGRDRASAVLGDYTVRQGIGVEVEAPRLLVPGSTVVVRYGCPSSCTARVTVMAAGSPVAAGVQRCRPGQRNTYRAVIASRTQPGMVPVKAVVECGQGYGSAEALALSPGDTGVDPAKYRELLGRLARVIEEARRLPVLPDAWPGLGLALRDAEEALGMLGSLAEAPPMAAYTALVGLLGRLEGLVEQYRRLYESRRAALESAERTVDWYRERLRALVSENPLVLALVKDIGDFNVFGHEVSIALLGSSVSAYSSGLGWDAFSEARRAVGDAYKLYSAIEVLVARAKRIAGALPRAWLAAARDPSLADRLAEALSRLDADAVERIAGQAPPVHAAVRPRARTPVPPLALPVDGRWAIVFYSPGEPSGVDPEPLSLDTYPYEQGVVVVAWYREPPASIEYRAGGEVYAGVPRAYGRPPSKRAAAEKAWRLARAARERGLDELAEVLDRLAERAARDWGYAVAAWGVAGLLEEAGLGEKGGELGEEYLAALLLVAAVAVMVAALLS